MHQKTIITIALIFCLSGCKEIPEEAQERNPENALATFQLEEGFQIEMVAAEPLIADPVDMFIDEYGRMFVVEMHGYPLDLSGSGKIKMLRDTNGDGQMDESIVFADGLILPTGIMRWKEGLLVTDPPNVYYLADSNGDGKADIKETVLTGFAVSNPQHNVNSPRLGMDNWIYLGHESAVTTVQYEQEFGDRGNEIHFPNHPDQPRLPQNALGRGVRFRPDSNELEMLSSKTQFGHSWDAFGHRFLVNNNNHIIQEVLNAKYLKRNPHLLVSNVTASISDHGNAAEVFPITINPEHQLLTDVGVITSACGILNYLGGAFPPGYENAVFVAEPVSNLIHMDILEENGVLFTAKRKNQDREFLASTDSWFRPVNHYVGPDGALYVVDYYRQIIEHPEWMADEVVQSGALYNGTDKGRIYRITQKGTAPISWSDNIKLGEASPEELVENLKNPSIWWRMNAQRLLMDRTDPKQLQYLIDLAHDDKHAFGKLHALWTLQGKGQLTYELISNTLNHSEAGVRENAIRLAEMNLENFPLLKDDLYKLTKDSDSKVRFQLLCTLGDLTGASAMQARQTLLFKDIEEEWVQVAALSATDVAEDNLLNGVLEVYKEEIPAYASLVQKLSARVTVGGSEKMLADLLKKATEKPHKPWQAPLLNGLAEGMKASNGVGRKWEEGQNILVRAAFSHPSLEVKNASVNALGTFQLTQNDGLKGGIHKASQWANDKQIPLGERVVSIRFLGLASPEHHRELFQDLLETGEPAPVQSAALQALNKINDISIAKYMLEKWPNLTPGIRDQAISLLLTNSSKMNLLLEGIEKGVVQENEIGWERRVRLMNHHDEKLKKRARDIFALPKESRQEILQKYQVALKMEGSAIQGKTIYENNCSICHKMGERMGHAYGPDLATLGNRRPQNLLEDILDPNLSIADSYDLWFIELQNGEQLQGTIASETPMAIQLLYPGGVERTIGRQDIKTLKVLEMSAMPIGLEENLTPQEMADLLAFIKKK